MQAVDRQDRSGTDGNAEPYLIEGERPETAYPEDARHWTIVYRELVAFAEGALLRSGDSLPRRSSQARWENNASFIRAHLEKLRARLTFWQQRYWQLAGLDLVDNMAALEYGGQTRSLTRREAQLLGFLAAQPGTYFTAEQLLLHAWHAPALSTEQVRSYVVRLRRHLEEMGMPCSLVQERGHGYALVLRDTQVKGASGRA